MSALPDSKLGALETLTGSTGAVQDLEAAYLVLLGATPSTIYDMWMEVFDTAAIPAGHFNDRWMAYMDSVLAPATEDAYNDREREYWDGGGTPIGPVVPVPPALANLQHWFDLTDNSTVWADVGRTIPATHGSIVRVIDNKGTSTLLLKLDGNSGAIGFPLYAVSSLNGLNTMGDSVARNILGQVGGGNISGPTGMAMAAVGRQRTIPVASANVRFSWDNTQVDIDGEGDFSAGNWVLKSNGAGTLDSLQPVNAFEWNYAYGSYATGDNNYKAGGSAELNDAGAYAQIGDFRAVFFGVDDSDWAESMVWDRPLTPAERTALVAYFDAKYGALPITAPPPAAVELLHHYDFTEPQTVFKNLPANQPAADGDDIRVLSNLGSDGTQLSNASGTVAPTYKTGIVNGLNVARYDTTFDTLNAVITAGHTGSTKGLTYAAVFNMRLEIGAAAGPFTKWSNNFRLGRNFGAAFHEGLAIGAGSLFSLGAMTVGPWYLWYMALDSTATPDLWQLSGEIQQSAVAPAVIDIPPGSTFEIEIAGVQFDVAEVGFWDGPLTAAELVDLVAYADAKYGTLPHA